MQCKPIENILLNVFGRRFSTPDYTAHFCSYQVPTVVFESRDVLLDSGDNFSSRYFAKKNYLSEKRSLIPWGLRVPIWKINFCSSVLRLSELPRCNRRPQTAIFCLEWLGRWKCPAIGLDASFSFLSTSRRCSRNRSPCRLPVSPMYNLLQ